MHERPFGNSDHGVCRYVFVLDMQPSGRSQAKRSRGVARVQSQDLVDHPIEMVSMQPESLGVDIPMLLLQVFQLTAYELSMMGLTGELVQAESECGRDGVQRCDYEDVALACQQRREFSDRVDCWRRLDERSSNVGPGIGFLLQSAPFSKYVMARTSSLSAISPLQNSVP